MRHIYIYETPESTELGLIKIGDAVNVDQRIREQLNTASAFDSNRLAYTLLHDEVAIKDDGTAFRDHDIHAALASKGYEKHQIHDGNILLKGSTEWFKIDRKKVIALIAGIKAGKRPEEIDIDRFNTFLMRPEQASAVQQTIEYLNTSQSSDTVEMLWNAKMRFGKTFAAYQLAKAMGLTKVLVITYKPAVEDAWQTDLESHVDFKDYVFLRGEGLAHIDDHLARNKRVVAFASYQDLLGGDSSGGEIKNKHTQLFGAEWDLVIVDEFHYGAGTKKAKALLADQIEVEGGTKKELQALEKELVSDEDEIANDEIASEVIDDLVNKEINSKRHLYLSGTPFKAMADGRFPAEAIFNWTYTDEQRAKEQWSIKNPDNTNDNPYRGLPRIQLYLYKVSQDLLLAGNREGKDEFSLNHFFLTDRSGKFVHEQAVQKWLNLISGVSRPGVPIDEEIVDTSKIQPSQYPFDPESGLFDELNHTLWYLNRVSSAHALANLLKNHVVFKNFHIILAAGKGFGSGREAVNPVREAIARNAKTITLSVGKLTTGVSIPEWRAVMFLRDIASPENYFQTAFRAQTPYTVPGTEKIKETCYIFDFSPNRSLRLLTTYSEKLSPDSHNTTSERKIAEFIRYLPVLKVDGNRMIEMDAREVLTFDLSGVDAKGLGERFVERRNIVVTSETINAINASLQSQARCQAIFDKIKLFRKYNGASDKDMEDSDANVIDLDVNEKKIRDLKTKETNNEREEKKREKDLDQAEKEQKSEREKVRDLLRTLLSRVPIFMYLTDATEENLEQVLIATGNDLFRKTTGIQIDDFRYLVELGLLKIESIDGYILRFIQLENQNYDVSNCMEADAVAAP